MGIFTSFMEFIGAYEPEEVSVITTSYSSGDPDRDYETGQEIAARGRSEGIQSDRVTLAPWGGIAHNRNSNERNHEEEDPALWED